jgi:hypothetical protein
VNAASSPTAIAHQLGRRKGVVYLEARFPSLSAGPRRRSTSPAGPHGASALAETVLKDGLPTRQLPIAVLMKEGRLATSP